jgi:hypothetical protein
MAGYFISSDNEKWDTWKLLKTFIENTTYYKCYNEVVEWSRTLIIIESWKDPRE